jgi:predicted GH43/DUF377 family glycosyl hydrolase
MWYVGARPALVAMLRVVDLEDPTKVLRRTDEWVFGPSAPYEISGDVGRVVFPCGWIRDEATDQLHIYYGGADTVVGVATARLSDVLARLLDAPAGDIDV